MSFKKNRTYLLKDICLKIGSGSTPKGGSSVYGDFDVSFIRSQNIYNNYFDYSGLVHITDEAAQKLKGVEVFEKDILLNITGDSVARCTIVPQDVLPSRVNQHVCIIRADDRVVDYRYLKYFFVNPIMQKKMLSLAQGGGTRAALTKKMIEDFKIELPPISEQNRISNILYSLDKKIELNNEMNKTLEEMAQALFKRWFVDFEFSNEDGTAYKSSGGEMVESELGMIPKGWKSGVLGELIKVQNGYAFKSKDLNDEGNIRVIKIKNISNNSVNVNTSQFITNEIYRNIDEKFKIYSGDLLIAMTGAEVGKIGIVPKLDEILMLNQRVGKIQEVKKGGKAYAFNMMIENTFKEKVLSIASGSAQPNISASGIENIKLVIADDIVMLKFSGLVDNFIKRKCENDYETNMLSNLRDLLLPKLMSGEIKVEDIEASL